MTIRKVIDAAAQLESMGHAVIATDPDGVVVAWNPAAERIYEWAAAEAIGRSIYELCVPEPTREQAEEIMAALRAGRSWSGGFLVRRKNGTMFPALVTDSAIYHAGTLAGVVGVSTNLGNALKPLLERSTDAALILRADGIITYACPATQELFGWTEADVLGQPIVPLLHPADGPELARFLTKVVTEPGPHPPLEIRVRRNGSWQWAEAALTNFLDDPVVRGVVCNLRSSRRREALEEAENRAEQLQTALDTRLVIELAKGYLAGRDGICPEVAFERIRQHARSHHLALREVARRIVDGSLELSA